TKQLTPAASVSGGFGPWMVLGILHWMYAFVQFKPCEKECQFRKRQRRSASIERRCIAGSHATRKTARPVCSEGRLVAGPELCLVSLPNVLSALCWRRLQSLDLKPIFGPSAD